MGGGWRQIDLLQAERSDFVVLTIPYEMSEVAPERARARWALAIVAGMLALMTFGLVPNVVAVLLAALALILAGCLSMKDAYESINWPSVVLIAGMLPMAQALDKTGGVKLIVNQVAVLGDLGPHYLLFGLFVITAGLSQFMSNTATAVLLAPIALSSAKMLGVSPYPLLMTVAIAASTAFATPVASPTNTLVLGPGDYRFIDFLKVGLPLIVLSMLVTLLAVPVIFPLK
jgi:di/tricarboxylate transporter